MTHLTLNNPVFIYLWWDQEFHTKLPPLRLAGAQENIESSLVLWHSGRFCMILSEDYETLAGTDFDIWTFIELSYPSCSIKIKYIKVFGAISDLATKKQNICKYFGQISRAIY